MPRRYRNLLVTSILLLVTTYIISGCAQNMFYYPDNKDYGGSPAADRLKYERVVFNSRDGTQLAGWFIPSSQHANPRDARGTVIHVHGNAANMTAHWGLVSWLPARGYNVFMFDYRGYGGSQGSTSQRGLFEDTQSAIDYVRARADVDPQRLLILAQSLGGNNAIAAVGDGDRDGIRAMVIESTFYSYSSIANDKINGAGLLLSDRYSAARYVAKLSPIPLLFLHGTGDQVIPYAHSEKLYAAAGQPKQLVLVPGGEHIDALSGRHGEQYRDLVVKFYEAALAGK